MCGGPIRILHRLKKAPSAHYHFQSCVVCCKLTLAISNGLENISAVDGTPQTCHSPGMQNPTGMQAHAPHASVYR